MSGNLFLPVPSIKAAAQTPPDRDRIIDAARAVSLVVVVAGHAIMGVVTWKYGVPRVGNLLAAYPWTQALTWILQIVPLFFFAGGAANTISWEKHVARGGTFAEWMWQRVERFLRPLWTYLIIMGVVAAIVSAFAPARIAAPLMHLTTQLFWFLGSYIFVTALTPIFKPATPWQGAFRTFSLLIACALIDVLRFFQGFPNPVGLVSFVLVWTVPAYLGSLWARGTLQKCSPVFFIMVLAFNLATNTLLIRFGPWPISLVGMPGDLVSNMAPPTVVLAVHSVNWVLVVALLRNPLATVLAREKTWQRVTWVNLVAMTLYLWHLPVLVLLIVISHLVGMDRPTRIGPAGHPIPDGWTFVSGSFGFWVIFAFLVWAAVRLMWPLEHARLPLWDWPSRAALPGDGLATGAAILGSAGAGIGLLMLSATGLGGFPFAVVHYVKLPLNSAFAIGLLVLAGLVIRWAGAPRADLPRRGRDWRSNKV